MEYVHLPEGSDAHSGHGVKAHWDERTVSHGGRDVLYLLTDAVVDTVCCGDRVFHYATVLGYVTDWKSSMTESGQPVSRVEPVSDPALQREVEALLKKEDQDLQVSFRSD
ncbi:MAG: hypothetical protein E4G93_02315 [Dehalococcoidia bacterium]|nr:MAG: hypothetical protein E4G93_02315 [Dehalococcoidia bacterium]